MDNKIIVMEVKREGDFWTENTIYSIWTMYLFFNKNFPTKISGLVNEEEKCITILKKNNQIIWCDEKTLDPIEPEKVTIYREIS